MKEVQALVFIAHPYHHPTIGWRSDIEHVPIEKLRAFYDTFYWPNNATVTSWSATSNRRRPEARQQVLRQDPARAAADSGRVHRGAAADGPRRVTLQRPGQLGDVRHRLQDPGRARMRICRRSRSQAPILSDGKSSRLYPALVDKSLALGTEAGAYRLHDPGMFIAQRRARPRCDPRSRSRRSLLAEIEKVKSEGVTAAEIAQRRAPVPRPRKPTGVTARPNVASSLNEWIAVGDWTLFARYAELSRESDPGRCAARGARNIWARSEHDGLVCAGGDEMNSPANVLVLGSSLLTSATLAAPAIRGTDRPAHRARQDRGH